ncbi:MAG TPA: hypothetical protein VF469_14115 [Kofleriaceae bacterium]
MSRSLPPRALRRFDRAAQRDRPGTVHLRASWGAHHPEIAAAGAPAIVVAWSSPLDLQALRLAQAARANNSLARR